MFDVYWIAKDSFLVGRIRGILDAKAAEQIVSFFETKEAMSKGGFSRFLDLNQLEGIELSSYDIAQLAARRREFNPNEIIVKSALFATDPLALGLARMYERLLQSPRIEVRVFDDVPAAAHWLGVDLDSLKL